MIIYEKGGFDGPSKLFRIHGSAVYKVILPAILSTTISFMYDYYEFAGVGQVNIPFVRNSITDRFHSNNSNNNTNDNMTAEDFTIVRHPYTIGAFIAIFSRYWEGATAVYTMISKWLDCAILLGAFHYQSNQFDEIRPPCFGSSDVPITEEHLYCYDRETPRSMTKRQDEIDGSMIMSAIAEDNSPHRRKSYVPFAKLRSRRRNRTIPGPPKQRTKSINIPMTEKERLNREKMLSKIPVPMRFQDQLLNSNNDSRYAYEAENLRTAKLLEMKSGHTATATRNITRSSRIPAPSLFLQETAHLISLLNAVALSTLRNDIDIAESPITPYIPGVPLPDVDPDNLPKETKQQYGDGNLCSRWLYFCLGLSRSAKRRTLYNAARPFGVLGGVSDSEIYALQRARGPYGKVALVTMWLQEFISREYLAGSAGRVPEPCISRIHQFLSDGVVGYNQARKVAYVPFPFVSAQIATFFSVVIIFVFPLLFSNFVTNVWFASTLNFLTVLCFLGLNEVSRELDKPFQNIPNDIPLTTYQAEMNEALVTMYAGFHPDGWWEIIDTNALTF